MKHYNSTQEFYKSDDWKNCKAQITQDRMKDGAIYCEHCGKIITKGFNPRKKNNAGAAVFHHTTYLNNSNVNDASISINTGKNERGENAIQILHWQCHNEVHGRFNGTNTKPEKKVYIITGAPGSGKREFIKERIQPGDVVLDIDDLWQCLSGQERYTKPAALKALIFPTRLAIKEMIARGTGNWRNAWIVEGRLATAKELQDEADKFKAHNVEVITMEATREECIDRLRAEPHGRNLKEYEEYIEEYFQKKK